MNKLSLDSLYLEFTEGAARALFVDAWASEKEREAEDTGVRAWPPGSELMDIAPETPAEAILEAGRLLGMLEEANKTSVHVLVAAAAKADGVSEIDVSEFGHYIAMQALGHGVSWFDDHKKFSIKIPNFEFRGQF